MPGNTIPDELRSDHLFLLVGTNPLPNWVAIKLLLRNGGRIYLVHSKTTLKVAKRLENHLLSQSQKNFKCVAVSDEHSAHAVRQVIENELKSITSGSIGLNYTGGTKVMAVHSYRAMEERGRQKVVFSYLEAPEFLMQFDPIVDQARNVNYPTGHKEQVGLVEDVRLTLEELFSLHEVDRLKQAIDRNFRVEAAYSSLSDLHSAESGRRVWRGICSNSLKYGKTHPPPRGVKSGEFRPEAGLKKEKLNWQSLNPAISSPLADIAEALIPGGSGGDKTLEDVVNHRPKEFSTATDLAKWLDGEWLEDYTLQQIIYRQKECEVWDYGRNVRSQKPIKFQADVAATRGYQLHLISCYSGDEDQSCKLKLLEAVTRARQLGGEAARAALVCCAEDPRYIERQVGDLWDLTDQVKVFGRADLNKLGEKLKEWFKTGAR